MTEAQIKELLIKGEGPSVEFKRCGNGFESDAYETVCSFSNRFGGDILCGVLDNGSVIGVPSQAAVDMVKNFITICANPNMFSPTLVLEPEILSYEGKTIIHIHVPVSSEVHSFKKVVFDRAFESDVKLTSTHRIAELYIRKMSIFTEKKIYKYVELGDLRGDLIDYCKKLAVFKRRNHPWMALDDMNLLKSAKLYGMDPETGEKGFNLAAILLLGKDEVIASVCPAYKTDAICRKVNSARYDDRDLITTNLIDSYKRLMDFGAKHLNDKFHLDGNRRISLRDCILHELASNILIHREFTSPYPARLIIEKDRMFTENACRAIRQGDITPETMIPVSKNPIIASFFETIGYADELGSGTRALFEYTRLYSGKSPSMYEDDIFRTTIPLDDQYSFDAQIGRLYEMYAREPESLYLSSNQDKILKCMKSNPSITAQGLSEIVGISTRKIEENIRVLREKGVIKREGSRKSGQWKIEKTGYGE